MVYAYNNKPGVPGFMMVCAYNNKLSVPGFIMIYAYNNKPGVPGFIIVCAYNNKPGVPGFIMDVVLTSGCSDALHQIISVLANPGQNCLIPKPGFSLYETVARSIGVDVKRYELLPNKDWEVNIEHMESQIDDNTTFIIVNDPSNPCGSVYSREHLLQILKVAEKHKLPIVSDEIYASFVFPGERYYNLAGLTSEVPILSCSSISKRYFCPGWRFGWIIIHDRNNVFEKEVRGALVRLSQRVVRTNSLIQSAIKSILEDTPQDFLASIIEAVAKNAHHMYREMCKIPGLQPVMPRAAMYMMIGIEIDKFPDFKDDIEFIKKMISDQSVLCLPGQCFKYPNFFRVVLTVPQSDITEACTRIADFCKKYYVA
ncbi:tyrosine aminotransferase-like [Saccoglossus kowalevskii]|uniref:Tyrosine aminotransferase n=1 Tax=Saccoglossus kowalevskii TaxID=10224 RepID=A0ABM0LVJ8_SACKO|nr:PREDICTED: tyrosine aminotransferase-like [Saccoglossus kowalevskii]